MVVSFLLGYKILNSAFIVKNDNNAFVCTEAINKIFEIAENYKQPAECSIYSPSQSIDKIYNGLDLDQQTRFSGAIKRENATLGVIGFQPEDISTLSESAKNLSLSKYCLVIIADDEDKENIHKNNRIRVVNPREFLDLMVKVNDLYDILTPLTDDFDFIDSLIMVFFREGLYEKMKNLLENGNTE